MGLSKISYNVDTNSRFSKRASQGEAGHPRDSRKAFAFRVRGELEEAFAFRVRGELEVRFGSPFTPQGLRRKPLWIWGGTYQEKKNQHLNPKILRRNRLKIHLRKPNPSSLWKLETGNFTSHTSAPPSLLKIGTLSGGSFSLVSSTSSSQQPEAKSLRDALFLCLLFF